MNYSRKHELKHVPCSFSRILPYNETRLLIKCANCSKREIPVQLLEQAHGVPAGKASTTLSTGLQAKQTFVWSLPLWSF